MVRYNWSAIAEEKMNPLLSRWVIHTGQMTIARLWIGKGAVVPLHQHVNQQVTMVKSGALRFEMGGESFVVRAGEVLMIPPNLPHRVEALEESLATDFVHARPGRLAPWRRRVFKEITELTEPRLARSGNEIVAKPLLRRRDIAAEIPVPTQRIGTVLWSRAQNWIHSGDHRHCPHSRHVIRGRPYHNNRLTGFWIGQCDGGMLFKS
jgi:quercetin dioxygenase-like cupin family protein